MSAERHPNRPHRIRASEMVPLLLAVCPQFQAVSDKFDEEWKSNEKKPYYLLLGDICVEVIAHLERGYISHFDAIFDVVERWHLEGDGYVREAATIGFLEDLQNENLYKTAKPSEFERWLRPESLRWWRGLNAFWAGQSPFVSRSDGEG